MWRDVEGEPVVFLEVDGEVGLRAGPDCRQGRGVLPAVDSDPHDARARRVQGIGLRERRGHVLRVGGRHALGGDGVAAPDVNAADPDGTRWISLYLDQGSTSGHTSVIGFPPPKR